MHKILTKGADQKVNFFRTLQLVNNKSVLVDWDCGLFIQFLVICFAVFFCEISTKRYNLVYRFRCKNRVVFECFSYSVAFLNLVFQK